MAAPIHDDLITQYKEPIIGEGLPSSRLADIVNSEKMVILHFLRHLGCIYCKHSVELLYALKQSMPNLPTIYFVHQSEIAQAEPFFQERFPGAKHISDPQLKLYKLFGIQRLEGIRWFSPKMILKGFKLLFQGYRANIFGFGDIYILSGTFLFFQGRLVWQHRAQFAGDDPKWEKITALGQKKEST